ncbi:MAG: arginine N-succinyltransferase [Thermodesulfobacteriota bacterium]
MNEENKAETEVKSPQRGMRPAHVALLVIIAVAVTAGITYWLLANYVFLKEFEPVELKAREERVLEDKLRAIGIDRPEPSSEAPPLESEPYSEIGANREIVFTERELNAMLAKNTDLARKLAINLSDNLVSAKLLIPLEEDFPVLGGKTLRVNAGVELAYREGRPIVALKGVSLMGVPIPNAWLGNLKNVDLVRQFEGDQGFWKSFSDGIEHIQVEHGLMKVRLKE